MLARLEAGEDVDLFAGDFADAFKQLKSHPEERRFLAGSALGGFFVYLTILFGIGSGPLVWGRVAAATMRLSQACLLVGEGILQCFVDDPICALRGTAAHRRRLVCLLLIFWASLGLKFAYRKATHAASVPWIGGQVTVEAGLRSCRVELPQKKVDDLCKVCKEMLQGRPMVGVDCVRRLAGQASWIGGIIPQLRPFTRQVWAALGAAVTGRNGQELVYLR